MKGNKGKDRQKIIERVEVAFSKGVEHLALAEEEK